jgi:hypothetical protein
MLMGAVAGGAGGVAGGIARGETEASFRLVLEAWAAARADLRAGGQLEATEPGARVSSRSSVYPLKALSQPIVPIRGLTGSRQTRLSGSCPAGSRRILPPVAASALLFITTRALLRSKTDSPRAPKSPPSTAIQRAPSAEQASALLLATSHQEGKCRCRRTRNLLQR